MPDYIVKTTDGRNLVIAAERYTYSEGTGDYQFYAPNSPAQPVASVPKEGVFAVVEFDTSLQADFYDDPDTSLLDSQEFVDAVSDIVACVARGFGRRGRPSRSPAKCSRKASKR